VKVVSDDVIAEEDSESGAPDEGWEAVAGSHGFNLHLS
jgi:hypothetical protein